MDSNSVFKTPNRISQKRSVYDFADDYDDDYLLHSSKRMHSTPNSFLSDTFYNVYEEDEISISDLKTENEALRHRVCELEKNAKGTDSRIKELELTVEKFVSSTSSASTMSNACSINKTSRSDSSFREKVRFEIVNNMINIGNSVVPIWVSAAAHSNALNKAKYAWHFFLKLLSAIFSDNVLAESNVYGGYGKKAIDSNILHHICDHVHRVFPYFILDSKAVDAANSLCRSARRSVKNALHSKI